MGETQKQVGNAVFWSVFARSGRFILGLASSVIVVRGLGDYNYGVLSVIRTLMAFVLIISGAGMGQALLKFLPVLKVARAADEAKKLVLKVAVVQGLAWLVLLIVCFTFRQAVERMFNIAGFGALLFAAVALASFELFFTILTRILNSYYDMKLLSIASIASHIVYICLLFAFMPLWGVLGVVAAGAAGNLVAGCIVVGKAAAHFVKATDEPKEAGIETTRLLKFSLPFALIGVLNVIVWRQSETLFLAHFHGAKLTGYFDLAYRLPQTMLEFIPATVWPIIMAGFSEVYARDKRNLSGAIEKYYKVLFVLCTPICLFGTTLGGRIVPILFGSQMLASAIPTQIFFIIFTVSFFATPLSMSLYVLEKSHANMMVYMGMAVINVGLDLILIPRYGIAGAMIPVGLVILISPFLYYAVLARYMDEIRIPFAFIGKCFAASSPILLIIPFVRFVDTLPILIVVSIISAALVLFGFKKVQVLGREEAEVLLAVPLPMLGRILRFIGS